MGHPGRLRLRDDRDGLMMRFRNRRTGNVISVSCRLEGPDWEEVTEAKAQAKPAEKPAEKAPEKTARKTAKRS